MWLPSSSTCPTVNHQIFHDIVIRLEVQAYLPQSPYFERMRLQHLDMSARHGIMWPETGICRGHGVVSAFPFVGQTSFAALLSRIPVAPVLSDPPPRQVVRTPIRLTMPSASSADVPLVAPALAADSAEGFGCGGTGMHPYAQRLPAPAKTGD